MKGSTVLRDKYIHEGEGKDQRKSDHLRDATAIPRNLFSLTGLILIKKGHNFQSFSLNKIINNSDVEKNQRNFSFQ